MIMGKYEFFEGQELSQIWWDNDDKNYAVVGKNGIVNIKISIETGQIWAVVFFVDGRCLKYNLALVMGVELALKG